MNFTEDPSNFIRYESFKYPNWKNSCFKELSKTGTYTSLLTAGTWRMFGDLVTNNNAQLTFENLIYSGVNHFDFGNNYGRPPGSSEEQFGNILKKYNNLRKELIISTKAGYEMRPGPNGSGGSKKHLREELEGSLKRLKVDFLDIFYTHRYDPRVELKVHADALLYLYDLGYFLYLGISSYPREVIFEFIELMIERGVPIACLQYNISLINLDSLLLCEEVFQKYGIKTCAFACLAQGIITENFIKNEKDFNSRIKEPNSKIGDQVGNATQFLLSIKSMQDYPRNVPIEKIALAWLISKKCIASCVYGPRLLGQIIENKEVNKVLLENHVFLNKLNEFTCKYQHSNKLDRWKLRDPKSEYIIID